MGENFLGEIFLGEIFLGENFFRLKFFGRDGDDGVDSGGEVDQGEVSIVRLGMLESSGFRKYSLVSPWRDEQPNKQGKIGLLSQ